MKAVRETNVFDYIFLGMGASNSLILLNLYNNGMLKDKSISIIDQSIQFTNNKTYCFWSTEKHIKELGIESLISHLWDTIQIGSITEQNIKPKKYYYIKGESLTTQTEKIISILDSTFYQTEYTNSPIVNNEHYEIQINEDSILGKFVFDSRTPKIEQIDSFNSLLFQSFYGWKIKTDKTVFDSKTMTLMDFDVPQDNSTQFVYTLPFNQNEALVELTRFGKKVITKESANEILTTYLKKIDSSFHIVEEEQGIIPMYSGKIINPVIGDKWIDTGSRANLLKCSTGYGFLNMARDAQLQIDLIKKNQVDKRNYKKLRFQFYDRLLLKILETKPLKGKLIFETLFKKVPMKTVLDFLDEKSSLKDELILFSHLPIRLFLKTAIKDFAARIHLVPKVLIPFIISILFVSLNSFNQEEITYAILGISFFTIGLAHGALDHLTQSQIHSPKSILIFVTKYLSKAFIFFFIWHFSADIALIMFILVSVWHFGQADFKEWKLKANYLSGVWGGVVLSLILFFHINEMNIILNQIPDLIYISSLKNSFISYDTIITSSSIAIGILIAYIKKSFKLLITIAYLIICSQLSLLVTFGIYFTLQHSINGWAQLKSGLNLESKSLIIKSLPFTIGGAFSIISIWVFAEANQWGFFFILLSCLSVPHIFEMNKFYRLENHTPTVE